MSLGMTFALKLCPGGTRHAAPEGCDYRDGAVTGDPTPDVLASCRCFRAQRAARTLSRLFDDAFRPFGITSGQFFLMSGVSRSEAPAIGALAHLLAMDRSTVTANLKPLERAGLVSTSRDETDRRGRRVALTEAGRALVSQATLVWQHEHAAIVKLIGENV